MFIATQLTLLLLLIPWILSKSPFARCPLWYQISSESGTWQPCTHRKLCHVLVRPTVKVDPHVGYHTQLYTQVTIRGSLT